MARTSGAVPNYSVTSAGVNPAEDRAHRMRMYFIAMSLRVVCVTSLFWVRGWWIVIPVLGSILLPWFAVMVGNAVQHGGVEGVNAPEPLKIEAGSVDSSAGEPPQVDLLIVDVDPVRRSSDTAPPASEASDPNSPIPNEERA